MSNPTTVHRPAGTPNGGQFAKTAQAEADGVAELDGTVDAGSSDATPTDPIQLIAHHGRQRDAGRQQLEEFASAARGRKWAQYDEKWSDHAEKEFDRYTELADAVTKAAQSTPAETGAPEPVHDLGPDPRDQLVSRLGDLHVSRQHAETDLAHLRAGDTDVASWPAQSARAAQEEFERMCAVVDAVRAGRPAPRTRSSAQNPNHLGYRTLNDWELPADPA